MNNDEAQTAEQYLADFAKHLVFELQPIISVKEVTTNTDLLGTYAEAALRRLIRRTVHPLHVSTGSTIGYPTGPLKQRDVILWFPFPAPGIFEIDDFALVPHSNVMGLLEVKRSNYPTADAKLEEFCREAILSVAPPLGEPEDVLEKTVLGVIGVIADKPSARLQSLLDAGKVVGIFETWNGAPQVRTNDVLRLVNFLQFVTWRHRMRATKRVRLMTNERSH